ALVRAAGVIECVETPEPEPAPGKVLVKTVCASLCGSDLHHVFLPLRGDSFPCPHGFPGHEGVGEVVESRAEGFAPGQAVLAVPDIGHAGCFADYQVLGPEFLLPLDAAMASEQLVLAQPLGTVIFALNRFLPEEVPETAVVLGQGSIGLFFTWMLRQRGVGRVIATEPLPNRRALSKRYGAEVTLDPNADNVVDAVHDLTAGRGAALVIEAAGEDETRRQTVEMVARDGRLGLFGLPVKDDMADFPFNAFFRKRATMMSHYGAQHEPDHASFREALDLVTSGQIDVAPLISHRLPLDRIDKTFKIARNREENVLKAVITFD
ncbi:MAG: zinc-dependent alcohol dehydrogenase, partial [Alphaproteobacteria bacterium]